MIRPWGFTSGVPWRVAGVALYAVLAVLAIRWVEASAVRPQRLAPRPATPAVATDTLRITIDASFGVDEWTVRWNGRKLESDSDTQSSWTGDVEWTPGRAGELFVEAPGTDYFAAHPSALRVQLQTATQRHENTWWGSGTITVLLNASEVLDREP